MCFAMSSIILIGKDLPIKLFQMIRNVKLFKKAEMVISSWRLKGFCNSYISMSSRILKIKWKKNKNFMRMTFPEGFRKLSGKEKLLKF